MRVPLDPRSRILQIFLTENPPGVCEVGAVDLDNKTARLRCTCSLWSPETHCVHHVFVVNGMRKGEVVTYPVEILGKVTPEEIAKAVTNLDTYREFMLHRSRIEVL